MLLRAFLAYCFLVLVVPSVWGDVTVRKNQPLHSVLDAYRQDGIQLIYSTDLVKPSMRVKNLPDPALDPLDALAKILSAHGLMLREVDGLILVVRNKQQPESKTLTLIGTLVSASNQQPIANARITALQLNQTTVSDHLGRFTFSAAAGAELVLLLDASEYEPRRVSHQVPKLGVSDYFSVELQPKVGVLENLVVSSAYFSLLNSNSSTPMRLEREDVENLPNPGDDALRAASKLPGVANGNLSARGHVRGGTADETLVLFDGVTLYDPYHLKDFQRLFSTIDPRAIDGIDYYNGAFPLSYGNRLSGVIDIQPLSPPQARYTEIGLSLFNLSVLSSGYFSDGNGEWLFSARRGNLDLVADALRDDFGRPRFGDGLGRLNWAFDSGTEMSVGFLFSDDDVSISNSDNTQVAEADYQDVYVWGKLLTPFGSTIRASHGLSIVDLESARQGVVDDSNVQGMVQDIRRFSISDLKSDWVWTAIENRVLVEFGGGYSQVDGSYDYTASANSVGPLGVIQGAQALPNRQVQILPEGETYAFYLSSRWKVGDTVTMDAGFRWDKQTYLPSNGEQFGFRFGLLVELTPDSELRFNWGKTRQAQWINELQIEDGVTSFNSPKRVEQLNVSFEKTLNDLLSLRLEGYYKHWDQLSLRFENYLEPLEILPELQPDRFMVSPNSADGLGFELFATGARERSLNWWVGYSWSQVKDRLASGKINRSWDQNHALSFGLNWQGGPWKASFSGLVHTGWPTTELSSENDANGNITLVVPGVRNADRLDSFSSIDFKVSRDFRPKKSQLTVFMEASNALSMENPCCRDYTIVSDANGQRLAVGDDFWLKIVPSIGVLWRF